MLFVALIFTSCASYHTKKVEKKANEAYTIEQIIDFAKKNDLLFDEVWVLKDKASLEQLFTQFITLGGELNWVLYFDNNNNLIDFGNADKCSFVNISNTKNLFESNNLKEIDFSLFQKFSKPVSLTNSKSESDYTIVFLWNQLFPKSFLRNLSSELKNSVQTVSQQGTTVKVVSFNWDSQPGFPTLNLNIKTE